MNNADKLAKYHPAIVAIQYFIGLPLLNNRRSDKLLMLTPMKKHQPIGSTERGKIPVRYSTCYNILFHN